MNPVDLNLTAYRTFQACQDGAGVFTITHTPDGWATQGHPRWDGVWFDTKNELLDALEGWRP